MPTIGITGYQRVQYHRYVEVTQEQLEELQELEGDDKAFGQYIEANICRFYQEHVLDAEELEDLQVESVEE